MANGRTHGKITFALALGTGYVVFKAAGLTAGLAGTIGCLVGLLIDPDLDIAGRTSSRNRFSQVFGVLSWVWSMMWWPYARVMPHRHPLSHWPILGTAIRVTYLAGLLFGLLFMLEVFFGVGLTILDAALAVPDLYWILGFAGLAISDVGHWLVDKL